MFIRSSLLTVLLKSSICLLHMLSVCSIIFQEKYVKNSHYNWILILSIFPIVFFKAINWSANKFRIIISFWCIYVFFNMKHPPFSLMMILGDCFLYLILWHVKTWGYTLSKNYLCSYFLKNLFILFIYFWLCWVFIAAHRRSLAAASRSYSSLRCTGFSLHCLLLLQSMGYRHAGFSSCGVWAQ